jgi:hypothetical protein
MLILRQRCSPRLSPPRLVSSWIGFGILAFFEFGVVVGKLARGSEGLLLCRRGLYVFDSDYADLYGGGYRSSRRVVDW